MSKTEKKANAATADNRPVIIVFNSEICANRRAKAFRAGWECTGFFKHSIAHARYIWAEDTKDDFAILRRMDEFCVRRFDTVAAARKASKDGFFEGEQIAAALKEAGLLK